MAETTEVRAPHQEMLHDHRVANPDRRLRRQLQPSPPALVTRPPLNTSSRDLVNGDDIRVIHAIAGEIIRTLTMDPERRYHGTGEPGDRPKGTRKKRKARTPKRGFGCPGCLATSHGADDGNRTAFSAWEALRC